MVNICKMDELKEYMYSTDDGDDFTSHDEYIEMHPPEVPASLPMPDDYIAECSKIDMPKSKEGEITRLLRNTPGIVQPVDRFPTKYVPPKPTKQPDIILNGIANRMPIFLDEKYFKFPKDNERGEMAMAISNNYLDISSSSSCRRFSKFVNSSSSNNNKNYSLAVSSDDESENDNNKNASNPNSGATDKSGRNEKPTQMYYNARQIYDMKRGQKH